jgi:hypothetical protein
LIGENVVGDGGEDWSIKATIPNLFLGVTLEVEIEEELDGGVFVNRHLYPGYRRGNGFNFLAWFCIDETPD